MATPATQQHPVVSREEWLTARKALLAKEKQLTKQTDAVTAERLSLPWVRVEKNYVFDTPAGKKSLADLFDGRSQLIVKHFMFGPGWKEGCAHCSFWADHYDSTVAHLAQRDTALAIVSRAPLKEIEPFKKRMGWKFNWVSSAKNDFNFDLHVSFTPQEIKTGTLFYNYGKFKMEIDELQGVSAFYRDAKGAIYHTYSAYARGIDMLNTTYHFLDLTAKGRDENPDSSQDWVTYRDKYKTSSCDCC